MTHDGPRGTQGPDLQIVPTLSGNLGSGSKNFCETREIKAFELALFMCSAFQCAHTCPKTLSFHSGNLSKYTLKNF